MGGIKHQWGELIDDEIHQMEASFRRLVGTIQESYSIKRIEAEKQVNDFLDQFEVKPATQTHLC